MILDLIRQEPLDYEFWLGRAAYWHAFCEARNVSIAKSWKKANKKTRTKEPLRLKSEALLATDLVNHFIDFAPARQGIYGMLIRTMLWAIDWEIVSRPLLVVMLEHVRTLDVDGNLAEGHHDGHYETMPEELMGDE